MGSQADHTLFGIPDTPTGGGLRLGLGAVDTPDRLEKLERELAELQERSAEMTAQWQSERDKLESARDLKEQLDRARADLEIAKREGNLAKAGELSYGVIPQLAKQLTEAEAADGDVMVEEAVRPEQIAQVVERWTGIPTSKMLEGELEYRKGNIDLAFDLLRQGIALEDALPYGDPPGWLQPIRHAYSALSIEQGRLEEAVAAYRIDLGLTRKLGRRRIRPNNVWSLHGLHECLTQLGRHDEARDIALQCDVAVASAGLLEHGLLLVREPAHADLADAL